MHPQFGILVPLGGVIFDGDWTCVGDVMRSAHGFLVTNIREIGELVTLVDGEWVRVY